MDGLERAPSTLETRATCLLCEGRPGEPWFEANGYRLLRCPGCGLGWVAEIAAAASPSTLYGEDYFLCGGDGYPDYVAAERAHRRNARGHLDVLDARHPRRGALLEIGCAAGFLLDEAQQRGWATCGVEVSRAMAGVARSRFGLDVRCGPFLDARLPDPGFQAVCFIQVLEHVLDPLAWLRSAFRQLEPGGTLLLETWDAGSAVARFAGSCWQQLSPPSVQFWFDRVSLTRMLERIGFSEIRFAAHGKYVTLDWLLSVAQGKYLGALGRALRALGDASGASGILIHYPLGDLVRVVARRP